MTYKWLTINNRGFCELWPHDRLGLILAVHVYGCMTNNHIKKKDVMKAQTFHLKCDLHFM